MYENEQEHVRCIMSTCTGVNQCMLGYQVIIFVSDNYKSSMSCKMSGVKYVRNQVITDKYPVLSGNMQSG